MSQSPIGAPTDDRAGYVAAWTALYSLAREGGSFSGRERNCTFLNTGGTRFADISAVAGLHFPDDGRAVAVVDWDQNGALDLWVFNRTGPRPRFLRNTLDNDSHYLAVLLEGRTCNRDAIGARVELYLADAPDRKVIKTLRAGEGYLAQSSKWLHFGLGRSTAIERLVVRWPGGSSEEFRGLTADRRYKLVQGTRQPQEWSRAGPTIRLAASKLTAPPPEAKARVVLAARLPMPKSLTCKTFDGQAIPVVGKHDGPTLINVWASWCAPCVEELADLASHQSRLDQAGLRIVALNVEGPDQRDQAAALLNRLKWPFQAGAAAPELLDALDVLQRSQLDRERTLTLPTSFLVDSQGRLAVIYKGLVGADDLLADLAMLDFTPNQIRDAAAMFPGRWYLPPSQPNLVSIVDRFRAVGHTHIASEYLDLYRARAAKLGPVEGAAARLVGIEYNLGVALGREGKHAEAVIAYRRVIELDPAHVRAHINLGIALKKLGDLEQAVDHYNEALHLDPNHALAHHNLAIALRELGRMEEAREHYSRAQELQAGQSSGPR